MGDFEGRAARRAVALHEATKLVLGALTRVGPDVNVSISIPGKDDAGLGSETIVALARRFEGYLETGD